MKSELLRFKYRQKYVVFDTETEGLNLVKTRPWQISWIVVEGNKIISRHNHLLRWENLQVSEGAARITGFSIEEYERRAECPKKIFKEFAKVLYDEEYLIIGQNVLGFDVFMINVWRKLLGLPSDYSYIKRIIDTRALATGIFKNILPNHDNLLAWQYRMLNIRERGLKTSQSVLLKHYGIPHDPAKLHDALYDNEMCFQVFLKQIYDIEV